MKFLKTIEVTYTGSSLQRATHDSSGKVKRVSHTNTQGGIFSLSSERKIPSIGENKGVGDKHG